MTSQTPEQIRRKRAAELLAEQRVDALLVTSLHNVRYLSGFTGSSANMLVFRDGRSILFTDPRYTVQSRAQVNCEIRISKGTLTKAISGELGRRTPSRGTLRVGFEPEHLNVARRDGLESAFPGRTNLAPVSEGLIAKQRMVKDAGEIEKIRQAVHMNSVALDRALKHFRSGMTETDLAAEIDYRSRRAGADGPAFDTIVASGARSALPHARPGQTRIQPGILLIDMGAFADGYASDMTRTFHVGRSSPEFRSIYGAVLQSQLAAIDAVRPGATAGSIDRAARRVLRGRSLDREFVHSTGHGLGLEIHEGPRLGRNDRTILQPGMAITIEPGVYREGWGGIRIEDTVLVTQSGYEVLTPTTKALTEI